MLILVEVSVGLVPQGLKILDSLGGLIVTIHMIQAQDLLVRTSSIFASVTDANEKWDERPNPTLK